MATPQRLETQSSPSQLLVPQCLSTDFHPDALVDIYKPKVNIAIWQRTLDKNIRHYANHLMTMSPNWRTRFIQQPQLIAQQLERELPLLESRAAFIKNVAEVVDMFSCLFDLEHVGFRMAVLSSAMCPKFHVDRVPCRLITTYAGAGTQWHPNDDVERLANAGVNVLQNVNPRNLNTGDVALLKGEAWEGNEGLGLVHRSPCASPSHSRLVLTLDFA